MFAIISPLGIIQGDMICASKAEAWGLLADNTKENYRGYSYAPEIFELRQSGWRCAPVRVSEILS